MLLRLTHTRMHMHMRMHSLIHSCFHSPTSAVSAATTARTYYIQAEKVLWNYTDTTNINHCTYAPYTEDESVYVVHSDTTVGPSYYRGACSLCVCGR